MTPTERTADHAPRSARRRVPTDAATGLHHRAPASGASPTSTAPRSPVPGRGAAHPRSPRSAPLLAPSPSAYESTRATARAPSAAALGFRKPLSDSVDLPL